MTLTLEFWSNQQGGLAGWHSKARTAVPTHLQIHVLQRHKLARAKLACPVHLPGNVAGGAVSEKARPQNTRCTHGDFAGCPVAPQWRIYPCQAGQRGLPHALGSCRAQQVVHEPAPLAAVQVAV